MKETFSLALQAHDPNRPWCQLLGPTEMTIATLSRIGWIALEADKWEAPSGHDVDLSDTAPHTIRTG